MILVPIGVGIIKCFCYGDWNIFQLMVDGLFASSKTGFELALYLTGAMCLWMGIMKVGEEGGAIRVLSRLVAPLFTRLFPEVPKDHPAIGSMMMNFSANMLGLDNAATPLGLKAMHDLQDLNPEKNRATNAQIMFLVLNTSGLTVIPVSILAYRAAAGSTNTSEVFIPILFTTFFSTLLGLILVATIQKINLFNKVILAYLGGMTTFMVGLLLFIHSYPQYTAYISNVGGNLILLLVIAFFVILAVRAKISVYDNFIEGAKGGFQVAINVIPYLVAILIAVSLIRTTGTLDAILDGIKWILFHMGIVANEIVDALPVAFMKPFSGSGARGLMLEIFDTKGVDSFTAKLAATFQGSTETTFYILSVYFGAVKITQTRYAAGAGLLTDLFGVIAAIVMALIFYPHA